MIAPTVGAFNCDMGADFPPTLCTTNHPTLVLLNFICSGTDNTFCWPVPTPSHPLMTYPTIIHAY